MLDTLRDMFKKYDIKFKIPKKGGENPDDYVIIQLNGNINLLEDVQGIVIGISSFEKFGKVKDLAECFDGMEGDSILEQFTEKGKYNKDGNVILSVGSLNRHLNNSEETIIQTQKD